MLELAGNSVAVGCRLWETPPLQRYARGFPAFWLLSPVRSRSASRPIGLCSGSVVVPTGNVIAVASHLWQRAYPQRHARGHPSGQHCGSGGRGFESHHPPHTKQKTYKIHYKNTVVVLIPLANCRTVLRWASLLLWSPIEPDAGRLAMSCFICNSCCGVAQSAHEPL